MFQKNNPTDDNSIYGLRRNLGFSIVHVLVVVYLLIRCVFNQKPLPQLTKIGKNLGNYSAWKDQIVKTYEDDNPKSIVKAKLLEEDEYCLGCTEIDESMD